MDKKEYSFNTEDFSLDKTSDNYAILRVKNIDTKEFVDTSIRVLFDDVSFASRMNDVLVDISSSASDISNSEGDKYNKILSEVDAVEDIAEENKHIFKTFLSVQAEVSKVQAVSSYAKEKFDNALGDGSLDSIMKARYGKVFLPNVIFIGSILSFLSNAGSAAIAKELSNTLKDINERVKNV